jgi:hypothetical protein
VFVRTRVKVCSLKIVRDIKSEFVDRVEDIGGTLRNTELNSMLQNRDFRNSVNAYRANSKSHY